MSIQTLDPQIFEQVNTKAQSYRFNKQVDINYNHIFSRMTEQEIEKHIKTWSYLNERSYLRRYNEPIPDICIYEFINFDKYKQINTYQMLKYLHCIQYNIETECLNLSDFEKESLQVLENVIRSIEYTIINSLPEYQEAKWSQI